MIKHIAANHIKHNMTYFDKSRTVAVLEGMGYDVIMIIGLYAWVKM